MRVHRRIIAALLCGASLVAASAGAARAMGTARIQQSDGTVRIYPVSVHVIDHRAVRISSADHRGTLIVKKAACSYIGSLERCLPYGLELDQDGRKHTIDVVRGSEFLNRTDSIQTLPISSREVPAHGVLLLVLTAHGTYITVSAKVDGISG